MSITLAITNHKGGVAKTTTTATLGLALARMGLRVLCVDLDAQANLTTLFYGDFTLRPLDRDIYKALRYAEEEAPTISVKDNLDLSPSSYNLAVLESVLANRQEKENLLNRLLEPVRKRYDIILIDCPPALGLLTTNALVASDRAIIPVTPEGLPFKGLEVLSDYIRSVAEALNSVLKVGGILITRYNNRNLNKYMVREIRRIYGELVFDTIIRENISIAESSLQGGSLFEYAPKSNGAKDYEALAEEIVNKIVNPLRECPENGKPSAVSK